MVFGLLILSVMAASTTGKKWTLVDRRPAVATCAMLTAFLRVYNPGCENHHHVSHNRAKFQGLLLWTRAHRKPKSRQGWFVTAENEEVELIGEMVGLLHCSVCEKLYVQLSEFSEQRLAFQDCHYILSCSQQPR